MFLQRIFGTAKDKNTKYTNTQSTQYRTTARLVAKDPLNQNDPVNRLPMMMGYDKDNNMFYEYNHVFAQELSDRKDWALEALKNQGSTTHTVKDLYPTHEVIGYGEEREYKPVNQDKWKLWGVKNPDSVWRMDI